MHDIKSIRDNPQAFDAGLKRRGLAPLSAALLAVDEKRRAAILASEQLEALYSELTGADEAEDGQDFFDARGRSLGSGLTPPPSTAFPRCR